MGAPKAGGAPGTTMAPPLAGSPRVQGHRDYVIKVILNGLTGPLDGKTYQEVMVPMGGSTDEWVAGIASYIRTSFGNAGGMVTPADVARVRAATGKRTTLWTLPELEATLPKPIDAQSLKFTASVNADAAANAATLRGWNTGAPQQAGMWFQIELPQAMQVTEVQFDSLAAGGGGGRGGRGAAPAAPGTAPAPAGAESAGSRRRTSSGRCGTCPCGCARHRARPAGTRRSGPGGVRRPAGTGRYPRGYTLQTSDDGTTWSKPVAQGKGESSRTSITFPPTKAKFIRITQSETAADAPPWSISNLRVYEAPAGK